MNTPTRFPLPRRASPADRNGDPDAEALPPVFNIPNDPTEKIFLVPDIKPMANGPTEEDVYEAAVAQLDRYDSARATTASLALSQAHPTLLPDMQPNAQSMDSNPGSALPLSVISPGPSDPPIGGLASATLSDPAQTAPSGSVDGYPLMAAGVMAICFIALAAVAGFSWFRRRREQRRRRNETTDVEAQKCTPTTGTRRNPTEEQAEEKEDLELVWSRDSSGEGKRSLDIVSIDQLPFGAEISGVSSAPARAARNEGWVASLKSKLNQPPKRKPAPEPPALDVEDRLEGILTPAVPARILSRDIPDDGERRRSSSQ